MIKLSFNIHSLKEFNCIVDMLLTTLRKGDYMSIYLKYSGIIIKGDSINFEHARVSNTKGFVGAQYDENGFSVSSTTAKSVITWLADSRNGSYMSTNNYLSFIDTLDDMEIQEIIVNGQTLMDFLTTDNNTLNIHGLLDYCLSKNDYDSVRVNLTKGTKITTMI